MRQRTRAGRLRGVDAWAEANLLPGWPEDVRALDVGFGVEPVTTVELHSWLRRARPAASVVGWDVAPALVAAAAPAARPGLRFESPPSVAAPAFDFARALNVGRGGTAAEHAALHRHLVSTLRPGGVALEGSTDTDGHVAVFHVLDTAGLRRALVFAADGGRAVAPRLFRDYLPRDWRRSARPGTPVFELLEAWHHAWTQRRGAAATDLAALSDAGAALDSAWAASGGGSGAWRWLEWRPLGGVPAPV